PHRSAGNERARAVDGVHDPAIPGVAPFRAEFFADDTVVWRTGANQLRDSLLGGAIRLRYGVKAEDPAFVRHIEAFAKVGADDGPRAVGKLVREQEQIIEARIGRQSHDCYPRLMFNLGKARG